MAEGIEVQSALEAVSEPSGKRKGTIIKKIVMHGFKSFGKRTELLFGKDFNCIIGPNGSGKSNVLDALCFVLGKSSSKSLRAERSASLIYNGGKTKKPSKFGEVSIYFDNTDRVFPSDDDTVKVTRLVKPSGQSVYKINDKTRTRQQILDLLALAKINPDGYNIILQGDIVRLVEMSPVSRREIVEEVAGISVYEEKKQQALRELEKVDQRLGEAEIVMKERQGYLNALKKDRDQAMKYKGLNDKIKVNKASYLKKRIDKKEAAKKQFDEKIAKYQVKFDAFQEKIKKLRDDIQKKREDIKTITQEVEEKGDKEQREMSKHLEKLRVELATNKTRIGSCRNEINRIHLRKNQLQQNMDDLLEKTKALEDAQEELQEVKAQKEKLKSEIEQKIADFKKKHNLGEEAEKIEIQIEDLDKDIEEKQKQINALREKQQEYLRENDKIEFQLQAIDERIDKVKEVEKEHQSEIKALKQRQAEFKKATVELNQLLTKDSSLAAEIAKLRQSLHTDREELAKLEIKQISIQESQSGNIAVKKILANKNKLGGVFGTVAELGQVSSKYSLALEIAAGPRMNSIIVKDDAIAAKAITFLKSNKFGHATFLPLNKVKARDAVVKKYVKENGVHGLAIDLIKFDSELQPAFAYVFGSTLVVDNIEAARKIGVGKVRMVTVDGDLVESTGAMTGGFRQKRKGGFKEAEVGEQLEKLSMNVDSGEKEFADLQQGKQKNEEAIERLRALKAELEGEIIKSEKSLHLDTEDLEASQNYKEELSEKKKAVEESLSKVIEEISEINRGLADAKIGKQKLRSEISELRNPILLAELNTFEQKRHELTEQIVKLDAEMKGFDIQIRDILGRDKDNTAKILKDIEKEEEGFNGEIKDLKEKIKHDEKFVKEKEVEQQKFYTAFKKLYAERNKLTDEISKVENDIFKNEDVSRQEEFKLNALSLENAKVKAELAGFNAEFEQYRGIELNLRKSEEDLKREISQFERLRENIGSVNMRALEIYDKAEREYNILLEKKDTLREEKESVLLLMAEIDSKKKELFLQTFENVNKHFGEIFTMLSNKGEASLVLEEPENIFEGGLRIMVRLTGNRFMDIRSLSGGEKTMTALAFLFAIQEFDPASFYILDEVDAALDKANSQKLGDLIRAYCGKAQYVVISHNDHVISKADTLYGVSMNEHGISKVLSLKI